MKVKGPKGELESADPFDVVDIKLEGRRTHGRRKSDDKAGRSRHGLTRTLINNMVEGVTKGFRKSLEIARRRLPRRQGRQDLNFRSATRIRSRTAPEGILHGRGTNKIHVDGIDKQNVGQVAAEIRDLRPPEPYKGKGVRYEGEFVRKKIGKAGKASKK